jgi:hypothetical protein
MRKYPSQYDAEFMLEWFEANNNIWTGCSNVKLRDAFKKADDIRRKLHDKIFGDKSPWTIERTRRGKRVVKWDDQKAKAMGL